MPRLNCSLLAAFLVLISCFAVAAPGSGSSTWSLRYLARASNFLLVASDAALESQPNICGIQPDQIQKMSLSLKGIIDQKISNLTTRQKQILEKQALTCELECSCDIYSLAYEQQKTQAPPKALEALNEKASRMDSKARQACARQFKEFCDSQLLKRLSQ